jgi:hypothetical protein
MRSRAYYAICCSTAYYEMDLKTGGNLCLFGREKTRMPAIQSWRERFSSAFTRQKISSAGELISFQIYMRMERTLLHHVVPPRAFYFRKGL